MVSNESLPLLWWHLQLLISVTKKQGANGKGVEHLILLWKVCFVWAFWNRLHYFPLPTLFTSGMSEIRESDLASSPTPTVHMHTHSRIHNAFQSELPTKYTAHCPQHQSHSLSLGPCSYFIFHDPFLAANFTALRSCVAKNSPSPPRYILISFLLQALSTYSLYSSLGR